MTVDQSIKLLEAVTTLIGVIAWPLLILFALLKFRPAIKSFFESLGEFSLKGAGIEASAKRKQLEVAASLAATASADSKEKSTPQEAANSAVEAVTTSLTPRALRRAEKAKVLWVDDRPENNIGQRHSLETIGVDFVLALSTEEAIERLSREHFDAIISDMGRPPDARAGYTLLERIRASGNTTPFIIYAGSNAPEHKLEALSRGALGSTNRGSELFRLVMSAITSAA